MPNCSRSNQPPRRSALLAGVLTAAVLLLGQPDEVKAQDANHWTLQWGTRSTLLGGAVIGSVSDLGAVYYNPARLGFVDSASLLLAARIYAYSTIRLNGETTDVSTAALRPSPGLVAGTLPIRYKKHRFAYFVFARTRWDSDLVALVSQEGDLLEDVAGDELFYGEVSSNLKVLDHWGGVSWAYRPRESWAFGISNIVAYRSQTSSRRSVANLLDASNSVATGLVLRDFSYSTWRILAKLGAAYAAGPLQVGVTVTTPSLHVTGGGSILYVESLAGLDGTGMDSRPDLSIAGSQPDLGAKFKSPGAVGFGIAYTFAPVTLHASTEWYDSVDKHRIMNAEDIASQTGGETRDADVLYALDSVINAGMAIDVDLSEKFTVFGSFVTDFSAAVDDLTVNATSSAWNIYHITGGSSLKLGSSEVTVGLAWAFGRRTLVRELDFTDPSGGNGLLGDDAEIEVSIRRIKFLAGLSLDF